MSAMSEQELNAIEARVNAATPGPWYGEISEVFSDVEGWGFDWRRDEVSPQIEADARFIAHAREDVPRLLTEVRQLREALNRNGE